MTHSPLLLALSSTMVGLLTVLILVVDAVVVVAIVLWVRHRRLVTTRTPEFEPRRVYLGMSSGPIRIAAPRPRLAVAGAAQRRQVWRSAVPSVAPPARRPQTEAPPAPDSGRAAGLEAPDAGPQTPVLGDDVSVVDAPAAGVAAEPVAEDGVSADDAPAAGVATEVPGPAEDVAVVDATAAATDGRSEAAPEGRQLPGPRPPTIEDAFDYEDQGRLDAAEAVYRAVIAEGPGPDLTLAAFSLGGLLEQQGRVAEAKPLLARAAESPDADIAAPASLFLGELLLREGDAAAALSPLRNASRSADPEICADALLRLGAALEQVGDIDSAVAVLHQVASGDDAATAAAASFALGTLEVERGGDAAAEAAFRRAIGTGSTEVGSVAALALADVLARQGRREDAVEALRFAEASGDELIAGEARRELERLS